MKNNKGFSLVELIIVIAIMAVLIGVLAPQYLKYVEKSRVSSDETAIAAVREATLTSLSDEKIYATVSSGAKVTVSCTGGKGTVGGTNSTLTEAVAKITGSEFKIGSKSYATTTIDFICTYDSSDMTWKVSEFNRVSQQ